MRPRAGIVGAPPRGEAAGLIAEALAVARGLPGVDPARDRLEELARRLDDDRFRLGVVGQFKRGKSTLLNALVGEALMPTSVLPATAVATTVAGGSSYGLDIVHRDGRVERRAVADGAALGTELARLVTEAGNPGNVLGLAQVDARVPSGLLGEGVVLVDTPGIGSTHRHNTDAARAALSTCDAVLVVFSTDLPIGEGEVAYLDEIRAVTPTTLVVMTKADLAVGDDLELLVHFLRGRLAEASPDAAAPDVWVVSARDAIAAKSHGDADALSRSGLASLERHLVEVLARDKGALLVAAVVGKAARSVVALRSTIALRYVALGLTREELDRRTTVFKDAVDALAERRKWARDLLSGDHRRAVAALDRACDALHVEASGSLHAALERASLPATTPEAGEGRLASAVSAFFTGARAGLVARAEADVASAVEAQRSRRDEIVREIAGAAEVIMGIERRTEVQPEGGPPLREPYWVASGHTDTMGSLTVDGIARLLPRRLRHARARRRLRAGLDAAIVRNLSSLQWAVRQWLEDAFRQWASKIEDEIENEIRVVDAALSYARERNALTASGIDEEREALASATATLESLELAMINLGRRLR
ncbi:dynamin family protein [Lichenibacterium dinghuense]|uniref:dynamin family protein n=1 Tax=Lichenibacterium dinghuense TaxID=2895977 RepID=UPI001F2E7EEE|nr:dynamin family protein [Lichenibacterium sp. 6Y81]